MSGNREAGELSIPVLSKDPEKKEEEPKHDGSDDKKVNGNGKDGKKDEGELTDMVSSQLLRYHKGRADRQSEEDQQLKAELELLVSRLRVCSATGERARFALSYAIPPMS